MRWNAASYVVLSSFLLAIVTTAIAHVDSSWHVYKDKTLGYSLKHPGSQGDVVCGVGNYGSPYDDQFGCKGTRAKLLILPWQNKKGYFEINVQNKLVQGSGGEILDRVSETIVQKGYKPLPETTVAGLRVIRFERSRPGREMWYLVHDDVLLELNFTYQPS